MYCWIWVIPIRLSVIDMNILRMYKVIYMLFQLLRRFKPGSHDLVIHYIVAVLQPFLPRMPTALSTWEAKLYRHQIIAFRRIF
jgi:hypothetical protein